MAESRVAGKCIMAVIQCGSYTTEFIIWREGGDFDDESNIWDLELNEFAANAEDIFGGYAHPDKPGFYVWEGEIKPIVEEQPEYYGEWRKATKEDMASLVA